MQSKYTSLWQIGIGGPDLVLGGRTVAPLQGTHEDSMQLPVTSGFLSSTESCTKGMISNSLVSGARRCWETEAELFQPNLTPSHVQHLFQIACW